jgi:hypothetical protein
MLQGFVSESPILGPVATTPLIQNTMEAPTVEFSGEAVAALKPVVLLSENNSPEAKFLAGPALPVSGRSFATPQSPSAPASGIFTGYNVYRDGLQIASNIPDLFYDDLALPVGIYNYEVSAQYDIGESALIGPVQVGIYSCFPPSGIIVPVATLGTTTADVSWTPSSVTPVPDWDLEYGYTGFIPGFGYGTTIHVTGTPQASLTGLYPGTEYDVFIRTNCSASDHSTWVKITFRTHYFECPVTSIPESEPCGGNTNYGCAQVPYAFEPISCGDTVCGTAWLVNSQRDADWYEFTLTETTDVTFSVYSEFTNSVTLSNGSCPVTGNITSWGSYRGYLYPYTYQLNAGTYYLMVTPQWGEEVVCDSLDRYWLSLKCSTCLTPAGLTAFNITVNSADLQWNSNATSWNIEWGPGGFSQGWGTVVNANTNPYTLNGLNEGYTYSYYVQSICNGSEYSSWAGPYTFSIPCSGTLSLPYFEDFSTQTLFVTPQCWQVMGSGSSANWVVDASNLAGGTYPELYFRNYPNYSGGTTSLLSPVINTAGQTELNLSFLHNLYPYNMNPECGISTTSDGGNTWNSVWTFSPYGTSGYESITISTPDVGSATFQFAFMIIGNSWDLGTWAIDDISLAASGGGKSLTVKLFLEGLYNGAGGLNQSYDEFGPHFAPGIADQVTLELRNEFSYPTLEFSTGPVDLGTDGMVNTTVPNSLTGNYYVTVRHRNSIETTTAFPVDFSGSSVSYDFTIAQSQAYFDNQKANGDGTAAIYGGDVNQDGIVDGGDMNPVDNLSTAITFGYIPEDVNGDGLIDGGDMNIVDNNSTAVIIAFTP